MAKPVGDVPDQWMTPGQAWDWWLDNPYGILETAEGDRITRWCFDLSGPHPEDMRPPKNGTSVMMWFRRKFRKPTIGCVAGPRLPPGYSFRDVGDVGAIHLFSGDTDIGCIYSLEDRLAYEALIEFWNRTNRK